MGKTSSPFAQTSGFFSLTPLWSWLQENLPLNSDSWLSESLTPTWRAIFWIILVFTLLLGTYAFWKRTFQSIKRIIIFINLLLLLYKKGTDLFQDILSNDGVRTNHYTISQGNSNMLVTLSLQEKILRKLQMVEGKVKDLEDLIITFKGGKKNCTRPCCSCSDCQSPLATSGFTSTSEG